MPPAGNPARIAALTAMTTGNTSLDTPRFMRTALALLFFAGIVLPSSAAATAGLQNPYTVIYNRNIFRLRPPMSAIVAPQPAVPLSTVIMTGISTVLGEKRAFLEITPPSKPPQSSKPISCILTEGQRESGIEVLQIDPKTEFVKVLNNGTTMTLTFDKNGRNTTSSPQRSPPHLQPVRFPLRPPFHK